MKHDKKKLKRLVEEFESYDILDCIDMLDRVRAFVCDPEGFRHDLLRIHQGAMNICSHYLNDDGLGYSVFDMAEDASMEIEECLDDIKGIRKILDRFVRLYHDEDDWEDEDEDDWEDEDEDE